MVNWVLLQTISIFFEVLNWAIIIRVFLSWVRVDYRNPFVRFIYNFTEPVLAPFRNMLMRSSIGRNMMVDFSPIIALLVIQYIVRPIVIHLLLLI
ncbi:YggT family protein [Caldanaerobius polysaccharolyticus]|uniref:YggT family protein n=1 Tax=Caldanaerobius polysaccharolyticus TaxID=44256 RepID=UPI00054F3489|nr:YggT family protein [Caldanaerobius polysaccharolyticus]